MSLILQAHTDKEIYDSLLHMYLRQQYVAITQHIAIVTIIATPAMIP